MKWTHSTLSKILQPYAPNLKHRLLGWSVLHFSCNICSSVNVLQNAQTAPQRSSSATPVNGGEAQHAAMGLQLSAHPILKQNPNRCAMKGEITQEDQNN